MNTKRMLKGILGLVFAAGLTAPAWAAPAVVEKETVTFEIPAGPPGYFECIGENATEIIFGTYEQRRVVRPDGTYLLLAPWFKDVTGVLEGESGRKWTRTTEVNPYIEQFNVEDGALHIHWTSNVLFKAVTPGTPDIRVLDVCDFSIDGNGDVTVKFWRRTCLSDGDHLRYEPMASGE